MINMYGQKYKGYIEEMATKDWGSKGSCVREYKYGYIEVYTYDGMIDEDYTGYFLGSRWEDRKERISRDNEEGYCYVWEKKEVVVEVVVESKSWLSGL